MAINQEEESVESHDQLHPKRHEKKKEKNNCH